MTEIFYGDFGTGKTTQLIEKIKNTARLKERCILFVPEQFSFDSERAIYFAVGAKYCRFVKVTGFSKLSREILKQYNKANPCADEAVKLITMWKIVERLRLFIIIRNPCVDPARISSWRGGRGNPRFGGFVVPLPPLLWFHLKAPPAGDAAAHCEQIISHKG